MISKACLSQTTGRELVFISQRVVLRGILCACFAMQWGCGDSRESVATAVGSAKSPAGPVSLPDQPPTALHFSDVTARTGVSFAYRDGQEAGHWTMVESVGGGAAAVDYDGDGDVDLILAGGGEFGTDREIRGRPAGLFRNEGHWRFSRVGEQAGLAAAPYYSHGVAAGDCDSDGFRDFVVTGYGGLVLYRNQGDGTYIEGTRAAGLADKLWSTSAAWGDLNGDGLPDLYVAHYINWSWDNHPHCGVAEKRDLCAPKDFDPLPDTLFLNNADGTFRDVSRDAGLRTDGKGLGVLMADIDEDGRLDIYVGNDGTPKFLYRNLGNTTFEEVGLQSGTSLNERGDPDGSMGLDVFDYNLDGRPDLWVANYEDESFAVYRNQGNMLFRHVSRVTGVMTVGGLYVGWGTVATDFDRDGDEDMFTSNGHVIRYPTRTSLKQLPLVFENLGNGRFANVASHAGKDLAVPHLGRGVVAGDFDDDGDLDLALTPINEPALIFENDSRTENHWLALKLIGTRCSRDAVGAIIRLDTSSGRQVRQVKGGGSFASTGDQRIFFGLGGATSITRLEIRWPSNWIQVFENVSPDRFLSIVEPPAEPLAVRVDSFR